MSGLNIPEGAEVRCAPLSMKIVARPIARTEGSEEPESDEVVIEGFAAVYNRDIEYDGFIERVAPGAFKNALAAENDIVFTFNHDFNNLLGRRSSGTATFEDRPEGLWASVKLPKDYLGERIAGLVERGDLQGQSFMGWMEAWTWDDTGEKPVRVITSVKVIEAGVVSLPAYSDTTIAKRSLAEHRAGSKQKSSKSGLSVRMAEHLIRLA